MLDVYLMDMSYMPFTPLSLNAIITKEQIVHSFLQEDVKCRSRTLSMLVCNEEETDFPTDVIVLIFFSKITAISYSDITASMTL